MNGKSKRRKRIARKHASLDLSYRLYLQSGGALEFEHWVHPNMGARKK